MMTRKNEKMRKINRMGRGGKVIISEQVLAGHVFLDVVDRYLGKVRLDQRWKPTEPALLRMKSILPYGSQPIATLHNFRSTALASEGKSEAKILQQKSSSTTDLLM
jgi:hypothetical protein